MNKVILKPSKEKSLLRKHPWIFSGAIKKIEDGIKDGDIVEVFTNKENYIATGHYNEGNISVRIFDFNQTKIDEKYWKLKIEKAYNQRLKTVKIDSENNVFRLIHAEGDHMPGFICDIYNKVAVFQFHSIGMWKHREIFTKIILELLPLDTIYDKSEKIQLRISCNSKINYQNEITKKSWKKTAHMSRQCYLGEEGPGTISIIPTSGLISCSIFSKRNSSDSPSFSSIQFLEI